MHKKFSSLQGYLKKIESALDLAISKMGEKSKLRDACEFALKSGGKRFRPLLVLSVGDAVGKGYNVMDVALGAEFFHTASLIADDLPCMDNETSRRDKPSLHIAFKESVAILASYTLIAAGYEKIYENAEKLSEKKGSEYANKICLHALKYVSSCAGISGATSGQYLDLFSPDDSLETIKKIIYQKTITLFEISLLLGWMYGGGDLSEIDLVKQCAYNLGLAFQIADDIHDVDDLHDHSNIVRIIGLNEASVLFEKHFQDFQKDLEKLRLNNQAMNTLSEILWESAKAGV